MTSDEFDRRVGATIAEKRGWFGGVEPPVGEGAIMRVESKLGHAVPDEFKHFAVTFGGGYFGRINVSTFDEKSDWYVLSRPTIKVNDKPILIVSDDESGGYYGFVLSRCGFKTTITYAHPDGRDLKEDVMPSFFEFIIEFALTV